ncbi:MAG: hypothetical protein A2Y38_17120 [Spirochaetes bacterium GWB1_59_5]|nr:MAG: hypothetical protein A2Y38_17120 [Spirochaetes bacterium GWB1_59_5]
MGFEILIILVVVYKMFGKHLPKWNDLKTPEALRAWAKDRRQKLASGERSDGGGGIHICQVCRADYEEQKRQAEADGEEAPTPSTRKGRIKLVK